MKDHPLPLWHITTLYFLLFCGVLTLFAYYYLHRAYRHNVLEAEFHTTSTSRLVGEWIKGSFEASDYLLRDVATHVTPDQLNYPPQNSQLHTELNAWLDKKRESIPHARMIALMNTNHVITHNPTHTHREGISTKSFEEVFYIQGTPEGESFVTPRYITKDGHLTVSQLRRIQNDSITLGMVGIALDLQFFSHWLNEVSPHHRGGAVTILDTNLNVLARLPMTTEALGQRIKNEPHLIDFVRSQESARTLHIPSYIDGKPRIISVYRVEGVPFLVMVGEDEEVWLEPWWREFWGSITAILLLWTMALFTLRNYRTVIIQKEQLWHDAQKLEHLNKELASLSVTDRLTGLYNRVKLDEVLEQEIARSQRTQEPFSIMMIDIDYFKKVNDQFGHAAGDAVLVAVAKIFHEEARETDVVGRWGGEEFLFLCIATTKEQARIVAERIRQAVEEYPFNTIGQKTISLGVSEYRQGDTPLTLLSRADEALYRAKEKGRNQVQLG